MRLREPRATALIFASGKMCVTGVKSTTNATLAVKKFSYIVERVGFKPKEFIDFKVQNIVGTAGKNVRVHHGSAAWRPDLVSNP